jgi:hypothetical protein
MVMAGYGCATKLESERIPPEVFSSKAPFSRVLGRVGVNLSATEITLGAPTTGELFKKELWIKIIQGGLTGLQMYDRVIQPIALFVPSCREPKILCGSRTVVVGSLALVAMAVGGVVGGVQTKYSESLAKDLEQSLLQAVAKSNDELRVSIVSASRALVFQNTRERVGGQDWAIHAFSVLDTNPIVEFPPRGVQSSIGVHSFDQQPEKDRIDSVLDARVQGVLFTDDDVWFSSKLVLRVRVEARLYRADDSLLLDARNYECVSVPRSLRFWSIESYTHVREEIFACNQLLGRKIADELLMATIQTLGK